VDATEVWVRRLAAHNAGRLPSGDRARAARAPFGDAHEVVQEHIGHSSYATTADIYSHVDPAQQREAADRLCQALRW